MIKWAVHLILLLLSVLSVRAQTTLFVSQQGAHQPPFASWEHASTNIYDALALATSNDTLWVADGVYREPELVIPPDVTVRSVHGASSTVIDAGAGHRCVHLQTNTALEGFTITGGFADTGAGVKMERGAELRHCRVAGNAAIRKGGGVHCVSGGKILHCEIAGNAVSGTDGGGGVFLDYGGEVAFCNVVSNRAAQRGGGILMDRGGGVIHNSIIEGNFARYGGGVMFFTTAGSGYESGEMNNCLVRGNLAGFRGGGVYANLGGELYNCTIVDNVASNRGGGVYWSIDDFGFGAAANSIVYYNQAPEGPEVYNYEGHGLMVYCCTSPNPGHGSFSDEPGFVDRPGGNYRLTANSPCVEAGNNLHVLTSDLDLDGQQRIENQWVDVGAYEFRPAAPLDSDGDGLPDSVETGTGIYRGPEDTGTSAFDSDSDDDGIRDGDEVLAGFDPNDADSVFVITHDDVQTPRRAGELTPDGKGILIQWPSVDGKHYRLLYTDNLRNGFTCLASNVTATPPRNEYFDAFEGAPARYYAVQLESE